MSRGAHSWTRPDEEDEGRNARLSLRGPFVNGHAMAHNVLPRRHELFQRRVDLVEINIGDEAVDAGVDAGGVRSVYVAAACRDGVGQDVKIGEAARINGIRRVAPDALEMVALEIEFARLEQAFLG